MKRVSLPDKSIVVILENNVQKFEKLSQVSAEGCAGMCAKRGRNIYIGVFDKKRATLHHELFHCIDFINDILFEFPDCKFSESNAYLSTYLFEQFQRNLK